MLTNFHMLWKWPPEICTLIPGTCECYVTLGGRKKKRFRCCNEAGSWGQVIIIIPDPSSHSGRASLQLPPHFTHKKNWGRWLAQVYEASGRNEGRKRRPANGLSAPYQALALPSLILEGAKIESDRITQEEGIIFSKSQQKKIIFPVCFPYAGSSGVYPPQAFRQSCSPAQRWGISRASWRVNYGKEGACHSALFLQAPPQQAPRGRSIWAQRPSSGNLTTHQLQRQRKSLYQETLPRAPSPASPFSHSACR